MIPTLARCDSIFSFRVTPVSSSRIVLGGLGRPRGLGSGLASFLLVMMNDSLPHLALLDPGDHVPQALIDIRIVDERSHRPLSPIHLAGDRLEVLRRLL